MITIGAVLDFKDYTLFAWIVQIMLILITIISGYKWYKDDYKVTILEDKQ